VAGSITWEQLRELAAFRADDGYAVSLYVGSTQAWCRLSEISVRTRSLLARAERQLDEQRGSFSHDERKALARGASSQSRPGSGASSVAMGCGASRWSPPPSVTSSNRSCCRGRLKTKHGLQAALPRPARTDEVADARDRYASAG